MKILPLIFFFIAIQISLTFFTMTSYTCDGNIGDYNDTGNICFGPNGEYINYTVGNQTYGNSDLWSVIFNPWQGGNTRVILALMSFALLIGALGFYPFTNRSDISLMSFPFMFMLVAPLPTIVQLFSFLYSQSSAIACAVSTSCFFGEFVGVIIVGPLFFEWVAACLEWWTGRPMS